MIHGLAGLQGAVEHSEGQDDDAYAGQDGGDDAQPGVGDVVAEDVSRVAEQGATTVSALAVAEHVRPQSMAETVAALRREGFITSEPDPTDGRKTLISISAEGRKILSRIPADREAWLEAAIEEHVSPADRRILAKAAEIMERLADS
ncbi:MarR family winged helix-turn-helix transcriptional regulator [Streptomyces sp. NPDC056656]|uniref:MarR family winged helix-turn-helix transcriptional regulator n=1 Tax=Streptomyces sp. NPDC056656 TaxID=3345895 RepID=UPI003678777B